jgi:riboflavin transporter FmnP
MFTGEIQNFILSLSFILPASLIYQRSTNKKTALKGMLAGTALVTFVACLSNENKTKTQNKVLNLAGEH